MSIVNAWSKDSDPYIYLSQTDSDMEPSLRPFETVHCIPPPRQRGGRIGIQWSSTEWFQMATVSLFGRTFEHHSVAYLCAVPGLFDSRDMFRFRNWCAGSIWRSKKTNKWTIMDKGVLTWQWEVVLYASWNKDFTILVKASCSKIPEMCRLGV